MKTIFSELLKGHCFFEKFCSKSCSKDTDKTTAARNVVSNKEKIHNKLNELIDNFQIKQHERAVARQDKLKMHNSFYAEDHKYPWLAYIELSDIVIFLEDYVKIFRYMGLINILQARSKNKKFGLLPQLKTVPKQTYAYRPKFVVFVCGDFYIACILGSRHILVIDKETYDDFFAIDAGVKSRSSYIFSSRLYSPDVQTYESAYSWIDFFDVQVNLKEGVYRVQCKKENKHLGYDVSTLSLAKEEFIPLVKELRHKFFLSDCILEDFGDKKYPLWRINQLKRHYQKLLPLEVAIPETLLTC